MINKLKKLEFLYSLLSFYREKLFKIFLFETYYSIIYFKSGNFFRTQNNNVRTNTIPCPYYFIHKISQFINKKKINSIVDLGCGFGRVTNFLNDATNAKIYGFEIDKEVFDIACKNKRKNVTIKFEDILNIYFNSFEAECFILNDPLKKKNDLKNLIEKIELSRKNSKQKYYLITINIDKVNNDIFETKKLIKAVAAGPTKHIKFYSNE